MTSKLKAALLILDLVLAAAAMVGCRGDIDNRLPQDSPEGERIGETIPGQDTRSHGGSWR
jgi:hypothetical protein